jgi:iron(III) transport system permease protein
LRDNAVGVGGSVALGAAVLAAAYLVSAPLLLLLVAAFRGPGDLLPFEPGSTWTLEHVRAVYGDPLLYQVTIPDTLVFAGGSVALTFVVAFALAWLVERTDLPHQSLFFSLILFPLLVPSVMLGIAWIQLFGPNAGWVNVLVQHTPGLARFGPFNVFTLPGLIVCQAAALVPFVFLLLSATFKTMNPALEEASSASGATPFVTFRRVTWPVLRPGVLAPLMLAALVALEQFDLPLLVGVPARVDVFSTRVFYELNPDSGLPVYGRAAAVALPFLLMAVLLLAGYNVLIRRAEHFVTVTARGFRVTRYALGRWRWPALCFVWGYVGFTSVLPAIALFWTSVVGNQPPSYAAFARPSFAAYARVLSDPVFGDAAANTLFVAATSALLVTIVGALLAWILVRSRLPGRAAIDVLSVVSIGIPSVIAGLATMLLYLTVPVPIYGTIWILVLAYSYRLAVATRVGRSGLMQIDRALDEASLAAGARWGTTVVRIVLPLLLPSLVASFLLLFVVGVREFTLPLVLGSRDNVVLGVVLWRLFEDGHVAEASAVASMVVAAVVPVVFVLRRYVVRRTELG